MNDSRRVHTHFTSHARLQSMLDVEVALAGAEASTGIIPREAATAIAAAAKADLFDVAGIESEAERAGNLAIPLVHHLTARVAATTPDLARYVHWGATSQDIIDTGLVLQLRESVPIIVGALSRAADAAAAHAERHAKTTMAGRTWLQQATPITFGFKAAGWCDALDRVSARLDSALREASVLQFGGASGTLAALGDRGPAVAVSLAKALNLAVPPIPWHTQRDRLAALACALGIATGTAGKIGRDLGLLAQTEIGEAHEPAAAAGGSSTMPQKRNPVRASVIVAAAVRAPGLVSTILSAMLQEHERGLGGWQAEWEAIPDLVTTAGDAARALADALDALVIDPARMRANLNLTGGLTLAEAVSMRLAQKVGKREAHAAIEHAARRAAEERRAFADVLASDPAVNQVLSRSDIDQALSPDAYLGSAETFVRNVLNGRQRS
ncbi:MAG: 3-carboxy-cis,cis-muconate cycloisomerase [Vicinamibacterales bacterium]